MADMDKKYDDHEDENPSEESPDNGDDDKEDEIFQFIGPPRRHPGEYFKDQFPDKVNGRGEPSFIEFKWNEDFKNMDQCDTLHMLYLLQYACELHRERVVERNEYFRSISRPDRYLSHVDIPQIMTNFIDWHNKDKEKNVFTGDMLSTQSKLYMINDMISEIGGTNKGQATTIYRMLTTEMKFESLYRDWTESKGKKPKLQLFTWGKTKIDEGERMLEDCTVEQIVTLFEYRASELEEKKEDGDPVPVEELVDGVFALIERMKTTATVKITQIDGWKEKIVEWIRDQEIDGKKIKEIQIRELNKTLTTTLKSDEAAAKKLNGPCTKMLQLCRKMPVHKVLEAARQQRSALMLVERQNSVFSDVENVDDLKEETSSEHSTIIEEPLVHLSLLQQYEMSHFGDCCDGKLKTECNAMRRVASALNIHQLSIDGLQNKEEDIEFKPYPKELLLNDYIHFVDHHADTESIEKIKTLIPHCKSVKSCDATVRHYRERSDANDHIGNSDDHDLEWCIDLMDSIHFAIHHLTELGLRIPMKTLLGDVPIENLESDDSQQMDITLKRMVREIRRRTRTSNFKSGRMSNNSKFTLQIKKKQEAKTVTKADGGILTLTKRERVLEFIWKKVTEHSKRQNICEFLNKHDFDTQCFEDDVEIFGDEKTNEICLIKHILGDSFGVEALELLHSEWLPERAQEKRHERIMGASFATGYPLLYWKWYRTATIDDVRGNRLFSFIDFGGHSFEDLSVDMKFDNLKQEVLELTDQNGNSLIAPSKLNRVIQKARSLLNSEKGRKIRSRPFGGDGGDDPLHFGITWGSEPEQEHMQALVLYCVFTKFCTELSKSLRKNKASDGLKEIREQNSNYFNVCKRLREMVAYFGNDGTGHMNGPAVTGPFYTGVNVVLNLSQFSIGLNVPTSTSRTKEIAARFAGEKGMLVVVGNQKGNSKQQPLFDASWISAYWEENECFWFGSVWRLSVERISLMRKQTTLTIGIAALYLFDAALSGQKMKKLEVSSKFAKILKYCWKHMLHQVTGSKAPKTRPQQINDYLLETLYAFCQSKTKILLSLNQLRWTAETLQKMIFYEISSKSRKQGAKRKNNIFRPELFDLFPNLIEMELWADELSLDLKSLFSVLEEAKIPSSFNMLKIRDWRQDWLVPTFADYITYSKFDWDEEVLRQFGGRTFGITLKTINFVDWMFIEAHRVLEDCDVQQIVTLFEFRDGIFAQFETEMTTKTNKITKIDGWKKKIVEWIREQDIDGKKMMDTNIKELNKTMRIKLEPNEKNANKLYGACLLLLVWCRKKISVHDVLQAADNASAKAKMSAKGDINTESSTESDSNEQ